MALSYPIDGVPETGSGIPIAITPDVLWFRQPIPGRLGCINVWAIRETGGWAIVDTGMYCPEGVEAWTRSVAGLDAGVSRVIVTHLHADHVGMAGWLTREHDVELWMSRLEYLSCVQMQAEAGNSDPAHWRAFFHRAGWQESQIDFSWQQLLGNVGSIFALPPRYCRLADGDVLNLGDDAWQVVGGSGHSPEHSSLYCPARRLLISGDQVLPRISSNIAVHPHEPHADPLADWFVSLDAIEQRVPDDVLVLPAHGEPFHGLHARLQALKTGNAQQLDRALIALAEPQRAIDLLKPMFGKEIGRYMLRAATGECLAYLNHLHARGFADYVLDDAQVAWWQRTAERTAR